MRQTSDNADKQKAVHTLAIINSSLHPSSVPNLHIGKGKLFNYVTIQKFSYVNKTYFLARPAVSIFPDNFNQRDRQQPFYTVTFVSMISVL